VDCCSYLENEGEGVCTCEGADKYRPKTTQQSFTECASRTGAGCRLSYLEDEVDVRGTGAAHNHGRRFTAPWGSTALAYSPAATRSRLESSRMTKHDLCLPQCSACWGCSADLQHEWPPAAGRCCRPGDLDRAAAGMPGSCSTRRLGAPLGLHTTVRVEREKCRSK
jgi:hypothetical protein